MQLKSALRLLSQTPSAVMIQDAASPVVTYNSITMYAIGG